MVAAGKSKALVAALGAVVAIAALSDCKKEGDSRVDVAQSSVPRDCPTLTDAQMAKYVRLQSEGIELYKQAAALARTTGLGSIATTHGSSEAIKKLEIALERGR